MSDPAENKDAELMISPSNFKSNLVFASACEERISKRDNPTRDNPEEGEKARDANEEKIAERDNPIRDNPEDSATASVSLPKYEKILQSICRRRGGRITYNVCLLLIDFFLIVILFLDFV